MITYTTIRAGPTARAMSAVGLKAPTANPRLDEAQPSSASVETKSHMGELMSVRLCSTAPKTVATMASMGSSDSSLASRYSTPKYCREASSRPTTVSPEELQRLDHGQHADLNGSLCNDRHAAHASLSDVEALALATVCR